MDSCLLYDGVEISRLTDHVRRCRRSGEALQSHTSALSQVQQGDQEKQPLEDYCGNTSLSIDQLNAIFWQFRIHFVVLYWIVLALEVDITPYTSIIYQHTTATFIVIFLHRSRSSLISNHLLYVITCRIRCGDSRPAVRSAFGYPCRDDPNNNNVIKQTVIIMMINQRMKLISKALLHSTSNRVSVVPGSLPHRETRVIVRWIGLQPARGAPIRIRSDRCDRSDLHQPRCNNAPPLSACVGWACYYWINCRRQLALLAV